MSLSNLGGWPAVLTTLSSGNDLTDEVAQSALDAILAGEATDAQIAGFMIGMRIKGESVPEITGMVRAMQNAATPLHLPDDTIDIVGVGGAPSRQKHALNVSTMAAIVAAAAGATVCKHGNRKASSTSGSMDVLEALGVRIELSPAELSTLVHDTGLGFAFARTFHPAMRFVAGVRGELGVPTVFNLLGPLSHPGQLKHQVIGVADVVAASRMIEVLAASGSIRAMVVSGHDSLDELTTTGPTNVFELRSGEILSYEVTPQSVGLAVAAPEDLIGGDAQANAEIAHRIFAGDKGPKRDIVVLNVAACLVVADRADDLAAGVALADEAIDSGGAADKLQQLIAATA